jgi:hypothetical protein
MFIQGQGNGLAKAVGTKVLLVRHVFATNY